MAAGSLIVTEAGGLVGNFTGEADFLHQREVIAGNPRIYAQLVQTLSPYTRVIVPVEAAGSVQPEAGADAGSAAAGDATQAFIESAADPAAAPAAPAPARRLRKAAPPTGPKDDDAPF